jgi:hypothetical protein
MLFGIIAVYDSEIRLSHGGCEGERHLSMSLCHIHVRMFYGSVTNVALYKRDPTASAVGLQSKMFLDRETDSSPSPPSSPSLCIDSSPASSPSLEPMILDTPPPMHLGHPFAASVKANRYPPEREKKACTYSEIPVITLPLYSSLGRPAKKLRPCNEADCTEAEWMTDNITPVSSPSCLREDREMAIWDMAITKVVDNGHGAVSLG